MLQVEAVSGKSLDVKRGSERAGAHHVQVVHDRARCIFGVECFTTLRKGLSETFSWAANEDLEKRSQLHSFQAEIMEQETIIPLPRNPRTLKRLYELERLRAQRSAQQPTTVKSRFSLRQVLFSLRSKVFGAITAQKSESGGEW